MLAIAVLFHPASVIGTRMAHHERRRGVEPLNQQARFLVEGEVQGAEHAAHTLIAKPRFSSMEQRPEGLRIVFGLEHSEKPGGISIALKMKGVHLGADSAHGPHSPVGEPGTVPGVGEVRVAGGKMLPSLQEKGRDPLRIIGVNGPGYADKPTQIVSPLDLDDPEWLIRSRGRDRRM